MMIKLPVKLTILFFRDAGKKKILWNRGLNELQNDAETGLYYVNIGWA
ncbi:MAG: hypothetical protein GXO83_08460 [Chlorobi bacterium]|nr:hypothetical protein [Chlorobiota bacterium]